MKTLTCEEALALFSDALDGVSQDEDTEISVASHIDNCPECARRARDASSLHRLLAEKASIEHLQNPQTRTAQDTGAPSNRRGNGGGKQKKTSRRKIVIPNNKKSRWILPLSAAALLAVGLLVVEFIGRSKPGPIEIGEIVYIQEIGPNVARPQLVRGSKVENLTMGAGLREGDRILAAARNGTPAAKTGALQTSLELKLKNGVTLEATPDTELKLISDKSIELAAGHIYALASSLNNGALKVHTEFADVETGGAAFELAVDKQQARLALEDGTASFKNRFGSVNVRKLQQSLTTRNTTPGNPTAIFAASWRGRKGPAEIIVAQINFQPASAPVPAGYQKDDGSVYTSARGYGWDVNLTAEAVRRNKDKDARLDTYVCVRTKGPATWKYDLPNGKYLISLSCGDPLWAKGAQRVVVEGTTVVNDVATVGGKFVTVTDAPVTVTDGQLTVQLSTVGQEEAAINYLVIKMK